MANGVGLRSERGPILLALMLTTFLIAIDSTILGTAVPTIVRELGGFDQFPWLFSVYLLAQAASVPIFAKLSDTFGRKPIMYAGIALFLIGSILCAVSWNMTALIVFRAVQGLGAGAITPTSMTIAGDIYTVRERAKAQAYLASVWAISSVVGPTLGGLLSQYASWRWIFWVNVPLCLIAAWILWRNFDERFERHRQPIDYTGAAFLTIGLVLVVLGILEGGQAWAWNSWQSLGCFGVGVILLVAFWIVERRVDDPVLPPWIFRSRIVVVTSLIYAGLGIVMFGLVSFVPTFLEETAAATPLVSGLAVAALTLGWPLSGAFAGRFYLRIGFRATTVIGSVLSLIGSGLLVLFALSPSIILTGVACFIVGLGLGLVANPSLIAAQSSVGLRRRGVVSGASILARSIGSSLGVAVLGAVANAIIAAQGGPADPGAIQAGSIAVFEGIAIASVAILAASIFMPHIAIAEPPAIEPEGAA